MATATQSQPQNRPAQRPPTKSAELLEMILEQPVNERMAAVNSALEKRVGTVAEVLPDSLKDQAERFVKRAELTFSRMAGDPNRDLSACTPQSIVRCVVEAAEVGLAIDNKLCYAIKYNRNIAAKGEKAKWVSEAQLQIDYKGLIVIARRSGQIVDCYGDVVCDGDNFEAFRDGPDSVLKHSYDFATKRGQVIGAYCILTFPGSRWRYEMMPTNEIEKIRGQSKAANSGPWNSHWNEMAKKTVARRALKLYCDDPAVGMALEIDEREYEGERVVSAPTTRVGRSSLNDTLSEPLKTFDERPSARRPQEAVDEQPGDETHSEESQTGETRDDQSAPSKLDLFRELCETAETWEQVTDAAEQLGELTDEQWQIAEACKSAAAKRFKKKP